MALVKKKLDSYKYVQRERLVYLHKKPDINYWDRYWAKVISTKYYKRARRGYVPTCGKMFSKYLSNNGRIIEAGCGSGRVLIALTIRGYKIEGVEWATKTVEKVKKIFPDLSIRPGDVMQLGVPDEYYEGYISLGVVEHREEGPEPFFAEAYRVLKPGGIAMISFPWFNKARKRRIYEDSQLPRTLEGLDFYQYAFTEDEMESILKKSGFKVLEYFPHAVYHGMKSEIGLLNSIDKIPFLNRAVTRFFTPVFENIDLFRKRYSHMIMLVCEKI